jgi:hypothetical protein
LLLLRDGKVGGVNARGAAVNAMFFALAFIAAANPKLLAIDLLLIENRRASAMFASILGAGIVTGMAAGLIILLALPASAYQGERKASAGVDLALGLLILLIGALLMTGSLTRMWERARSGRPAKPTDKRRRFGADWAQRALREPHLGVAFIVGFVCGLPGAAYLAALHNLGNSKPSTASQVVAVLVFMIIAFLLIIIPWLLLLVWPSGTEGLLRRTLTWVTGHAIVLIAWVCILLGVFLTVTGALRLLNA